jgi:glycosyltransferase involved in cell wall biosynthesis
MPRFSLIVATRDRTTELARLIASLDEQTYSDFELIIVDQNDDERLVPIIQFSSSQERIIHLRCQTGVSLARNAGMEAAQGEIIGFPDDDCWYPPNTLKDVSSWFDANPSYEILSLTSRDANGEQSGNGWFQHSCDLTILNIYRTSIGYAYFIRSNGISRRVRFDEGIGPGAKTPYLGGEDTDFVLEAMKRGARGRYEAKWHIGHPRKDVRSARVSKDRIYIYGRGMGFVQRKHGLGGLWAAFVAYDYVRAACFFLLGRRVQAGLWYQHGRGLIEGFRRSSVRVAR